jgi:adenylosuccinate lyase
MKKNVELTHGLIFSGQLLLDLAAAGMLREEAYERVQKHAMQAWENEGDFRAAIEADEKILSYLSIAEINAAFSLDRHLAHVDQIFTRVFGENHI